MNYIIDAISSRMTERGRSGRFSTWPVPIAMLMTAAAVEYGIGWCEGEFASRCDERTLKKCLNRALIDFNRPATQVYLSTYEDHDNYFLLLEDYITF